MASLNHGSNAAAVVYRKLVLAIFLLLLLLLIDGGEEEDGQQRQDGAAHQTASAAARSRVPAVVRALAHHPPSLRIFRALFQINLMLWCAALCMRVWSRIQTLGDLLFAPVDDDGDGNIHAHGSSDLSGNLYKRVWSEHDGADESVDDADNDEASPAIDGLPQSSGEEDDHEAQEVESSKPEEEEDLVNVTIGSDQGALLDPEVTKDAGEVNIGLRGDSVEGDEDDDDDVYDPTPNPTIQIPTATAIASAATDMLLQILATLLLFTWTSMGYLRSSYPLLSSSSPPSLTSAISKIAAPTFPLLLFVYSVVVAFTPWKDSRCHMWKLVYRTTMAPCYSVTFRDGFLGDVLTSSVRPMQDVAFTVFYIGGGLQGWWSWPWPGASDGVDPSQADSFLDRADAVVPHLERSWIYYTVVLPMCLVSPLWWRFLQNLRQTLDAQQRWPFLGNAAKYFCAAQVAVVGIFFPSQRHTMWWLFAFTLATLYQIWWDIFMDWNLLERRNHRWQLRQQRAYKSTAFYWTTCGINVLLRFCWTLTFLPVRYLDAAGNLRQSLGNDVYMNVVLSPLVASAEIVRRSLWGLIRLEWEAVRNEVNDADRDEALELERRGEQALELTPMKLSDGDFELNTLVVATRAGKPSRFSVFGKDMSEMTQGHILSELGAYATIFFVFGALAAAHRETQ